VQLFSRPVGGTPSPLAQRVSTLPIAEGCVEFLSFDLTRPRRDYWFYTCLFGSRRIYSKIYWVNIAHGHGCGECL